MMLFLLSDSMGKENLYFSSELFIVKHFIIYLLFFFIRNVTKCLSSQICQKAWEMLKFLGIRFISDIHVLTFGDRRLQICRGFESSRRVIVSYTVFTW